MSQGTITNAAGGILARTDDNQGEPWKWSSRSFDLVVSGSPVTVEFDVPLARNAPLGRPALVQGELLITTQLAFSVSDPSATPAVEVTVNAFNGSLALIINHRFLGQLTPAMFVRLGPADTYERLSIIATVFTPLSNPANTLTSGTIQANLLMWR